MKRSRIVYIIISVCVIFLGLASRSDALNLPEFIERYAGDTLWALFVFLGFAIIFPSLPGWKPAIMAAVFSFSIEISQLYHAPWIDSIRHTRIGGLILGFGFLWSDLLCYITGILIGVCMEWAIRFLRAYFNTQK